MILATNLAELSIMKSNALPLDGLPIFVGEKAPSYHACRAGKTFLKGEVLIDLKTAKELSAPDYTSIDLGDKHVYHSVARYINHGCDPTAYVDVEHKKIVTLKPVNEGDEITINYLISERKITAPFDCNCGASMCIGRIEKA